MKSSLNDPITEADLEWGLLGLQPHHKFLFKFFCIKRIFCIITAADLWLTTSKLLNLYCNCTVNIDT